MAKPDLLADVDKYQLEPTDFSQQLDKMVFSAIYNLFAGGAEKIHTVDVDTYLQHNEIAKDLLEKNNGLAFIQDCEELADPLKFQVY